ncbi:SapC family protein [Caenispirillum bisanense]|uniref:SapC protein n=1 Tax=Caenispirillum bisanense TaxID=414052 RepID=A0A286GT90_9PROT|nr:SapC family protein [Caenispirillum bisanense]SOD98753.1 SapC protein [Caenispirillum bisanense]
MYTSLVALGREAHAGHRLAASQSFAFAAALPVVGLVGSELARAAVAMPVAFAPDGAEDDGAPRFTPVAVMGVRQGQNLFVAPDGRWLGEYVPALLRRYPFALVRPDGAEQDARILAVDEGSGRLTTDGTGIPLFDEAGGLSEHLQRVVGFLQQLEANGVVTAAACATLAAHGVIVPWELSVQGADGAQQPVGGLYRVDEAALNALPDDAFLELRRSGALVVAQLQLVSMQRISVLSHLARVHEQIAAAEAQRPKLDEMLDLGGGDEIAFTF